MNKYLRFYSPSLAPASSAQHVLVNVSKMTMMASSAGGAADTDIIINYGENKDFKLVLTFSPQVDVYRTDLVDFLAAKIEQLCEQGNNDVYMDIGDKDGIIAFKTSTNLVQITILTDIVRGT
jgi:hypothetical protein